MAVEIHNRELRCTTTDCAFFGGFYDNEDIEAFLGYIKEDARTFCNNDLKAHLQAWRMSDGYAPQIFKINNVTQETGFTCKCDHEGICQTKEAANG